MTRRRTWAAGLALVASLVWTLPAQAGEVVRAGRVVNTSGDNLRVRAAPSAGAPILKRLGPGWRLTVLNAHANDGRWLRVEHGGTVGYVAAQFVALDGQPSPSGARMPRSGWVTNTDGANLRLRAAPRAEASIVKRLGPGWQVTILEGPINDAAGTAWVRVEHGGTTGYAVASYVAGVAAGGGEVGPAPGQRTMREAARLRAEPGLGGTVIMTLTAGRLVESTGRERTADGHRWASVRAVGRDGWVVASALGAVPAPGTGDKLAAAAEAQLGRPYVWGGETPEPGFDCSGLVRYVVKGVTGIDLTHVLARQAEAGRAVARSELDAGDLVFFENTYKPGLSHTGVYVGDGEFVNALNERAGVVRTQLETPYWRGRYVGARRLAD